MSKALAVVVPFRALLAQEDLLIHSISSAVQGT